MQLFSFGQIDMEKKEEEEEEEEEKESWSHPDVTLPHLLSLSQAFLDMLCLASGFQSTGSPALWTPQDVKRALGWASLLQQVIFSCILLPRSKFYIRMHFFVGLFIYIVLLPIYMHISIVCFNITFIFFDYLLLLLLSSLVFDFFSSDYI